MLIAIFVTWTACDDDFSESDFLDKQMALADSTMARQLDVLEKMGLILTYSIQVQDNGTPVEGIDVSISGFAENASKGTKTTGSDGIVQFTDVLAGFTLINLSGTGYIDASVTVYLEPNQTFDAAGGFTYVLQRNESSILPIYGDGILEGDNTATIKGKITIETNLVNDVAEVPEGIEIAANFTDIFGEDIVGPANGYVSTYRFVNAGNFGMAVVDAGGNYSITVPASGSGDIELLIPTFQKDQILAIGEKNGQKVGPEIDTIPVLFGPEEVYDGNVPWVPGAKAEFPMPPSAGGEGFTFKFDPIATSLAEWTRNNPVEQFVRDYDDTGDTTLVKYQARLKSRGSGYSASPDIAISGGYGTGTEMFASLRGFFTGIATNGGSGYNPDVTGTANLYYEGVNVNGNDTSDIFITSFSFATTTGGEIPASLTLPSSGTGFSIPFETEIYSSTYGYRVIDWKVTFTGVGAPTTEAIAVVSVNCEVNALNMYDGGRGYTSAPTFTFSGGGAASQATFEIWDFETYYYVDVDNSNVTEPYTLLPSDINLEYDIAGSGSYIESNIYYGDPIYGLSNIINSWPWDVALNLVELNSGDILWEVPTNKFITYYKTKEPPKVLVYNPISYPAVRYVNINSDGEVIDLSTFGLSWPYNGIGYAGPFDVTIVPTISGPGSGATIELIGGFYQPDGTFEWGGTSTVISGGSGYLPEVNRYGQMDFSGSNNIFDVKPGDTYVRDFHFGIGQRLEDVGDYELK